MKISIKKIIDEIAKNEDFTDEELIRVLYIKLGEIFAYNRDFLYARNLDEVRKIYEDQLFISEIERKDYEGKITGTCKQIEEVLNESIQKLAYKTGRRHIYSRMLGYDEMNESHTATLLKIEDDSYYLDLYKDLYRIQKKMKTKYFAPSEDITENLEFYKINEELKNVKLKTISEENLKKIDNKIGYLQYGIYTDDVISKLKEEMNDNSTWKDIKINSGQKREDIITKYKFDFVLKNFKNEILNNKQMKMMELSHFYKWALSKILTKNELEKNKFVTFNILENDRKNTKEGLMIETTIGDRKFHYIYDEKLKACRNIEKEEIKKLEKDKKITYYSNVEKPSFDEDER